ncbi:hypothetical protein GCM10027569_16450 [Flindersiella endophytica]
MADVALSDRARTRAGRRGLRRHVAGTAGFGLACLLACVLRAPAVVPFAFPVVPLAIASRLTPEKAPG